MNYIYKLICLHHRNIKVYNMLLRINKGCRVVFFTFIKRFCIFSIIFITFINLFLFLNVILGQAQGKQITYS